jgi:RNA polymerase sigma-70 factor (ECF subfamily)
MRDLALARRLIRGDESAFEEFFADYFPRLFRFARARVGHDDAAEDVVQCTLIRALQKLHTYRGEAALFTWLCTICRHEVAAWLERAGKASEVMLVDDHREVRAALESLSRVAGGDPELALRRRELARLVQVTLDHLPHRYGDALEWKYIEELSVDEIAVRLGVGYKAAESLLSRARRAFRDGFSLVAGRSAGEPRRLQIRSSEGA